MSARSQSPIPPSSNGGVKPGQAAPDPARMPLWKKIVQRIVVLTLTLAACAILVVPLNQQTSDRSDTLDFANFYMAGAIVHQGHAGRLYDLELQRQIERSASPGYGPFMPYMHPPFEALLFAPFARFSYPHAFLLWAGLNVLLLGLLVYLVRFTGCRLPTGPYLIWMAILVFFTLVALALGQDTLLLALVFVLAFLALKRQREYAAGFALGLGLFRFEILLPFVFIFLLRRRWKLVTAFCVVGATLLAVSAAMVGWSGLLDYLRTLVQVGGASTHSWADQASISMMPSLHGAFGTLLGGVISERFQFPVVLAATLLLLVWAAVEFKSIDRPSGPAFDLQFSLAIIAALLAGYHVFLSELTPLIVSGFLILAYDAARPREGILRNRRGTALLLLVFAVVGGAAVVHSQAFSVEVVVMLGLMIWLSREISLLQETMPPG